MVKKLNHLRPGLESGVFWEVCVHPFLYNEVLCIIDKEIHDNVV